MRLSTRLMLTLVAAAGLAAPLSRADMGMDGESEMAMEAPPTSAGSIARCSITISSSVREEISVAAAEVANTTANFVCSQAELGNLTVNEAAMATAESVSITAARAVARLSVNCFLSGQGSVRLNGMGIAEFEATALAEELAGVINEIKVCTDCNETASQVGGNFTDLFVPAAANATVSLALATTEENQEIAVEEFVESVSEVFVINFTQVLISSRTGAAEEGCAAPDMEPDMDDADADPEPEPDMDDDAEPGPDMDDGSKPDQNMDDSDPMPDMDDDAAPDPDMDDGSEPGPDMGDSDPMPDMDDPEPEPDTMMMEEMDGSRVQIECDVSEPVADFGTCAGEDIDVPKACASPGFLCVTKNEFFAACRENGIPKDEDWEGIVFECV